MATVYVEIDREGMPVETRGISGTQAEIDEQIDRWATTYGVVRVLDKRGKVERVRTAGEVNDERDQQAE